MDFDDNFDAFAPALRLYNKAIFAGANASNFFIKIECLCFDEILIKILLFDEIKFCICTLIKTHQNAFHQNDQFSNVPFI